MLPQHRLTQFPSTRTNHLNDWDCKAGQGCPAISGGLPQQPCSSNATKPLQPSMPAWVKGSAGAKRRSRNCPWGSTRPSEAAIYPLQSLRCGPATSSTGTAVWMLPCSQARCHQRVQAELRIPSAAGTARGSPPGTREMEGGWGSEGTKHSWDHRLLMPCLLEPLQEMSSDAAKQDHWTVQHLPPPPSPELVVPSADWLILLLPAPRGMSRIWSSRMSTTARMSGRLSGLGSQAAITSFFSSCHGK